MATGKHGWGVMLALLLAGDMQPATAGELQAVELELVLAVDVSSSVDPVEYALQMRGYSQAFRHRDVIAAISAVGDRGIAVTLVQWSDRGSRATSVDWVLLRNRHGAEQFATTIDVAPRLLKGFTSIGGAINFSVAEIEQNRFEGRRKVIDISGDGSSTDRSPAAERDRAVARGVTINGAVILDEDYSGVASVDLPAYYDRHVVGGTGAFLVTADNFRDFATVIRRKLLREITGPGVAVLEVDGVYPPGGRF